MKTLVLILAGGCLAGGIGIYLAQRNSPPTPMREAPVAVATDSGSTESAAATSVPTEPTTQRLTAESEGAGSAARTASERTAAPSAAGSPSLPYQQALSTLVSLQASYDQKQAAWKQIKDTGHLDQVIADLERQAVANPNAAEYPAALGQACLQKAGTLNDVREQGILGLKADQSFDAALNLDPSNWEAGFWKAAAMSYWPPQLGKGAEVIERFVGLVKLQENQPPQAHFAQTYVWLGDQYQKQGYPDYAKQTWQRGATLFPNDATLAQKLSQPAPEQAAVR